MKPERLDDSLRFHNRNSVADGNDGDIFRTGKTSSDVKALEQDLKYSNVLLPTEETLLQHSSMTLLSNHQEVFPSSFSKETVTSLNEVVNGKCRPELIASIVAGSAVVEPVASSSDAGKASFKKPVHLKAIPKKFSSYIRRARSEDGLRIVYYCLYCPYRTDDENIIFQFHSPGHMRKGTHCCTKCNFTSNIAQEIVDHIGEIHAVSYITSGPHADVFSRHFACNHCPFICHFEEEFLDHLALHAVASRYHCSLCSFSAPTQKPVIDHEALHFRPRPHAVDGVARIPRRCQTMNNKTPFFPKDYEPIIKTRTEGDPMDDLEKAELYAKLSDIVDLDGIL